MNFSDDKFANAAITWIIILLAVPAIFAALLGWN